MGTAATGRHVERLVPALEQALASWEQRVSTGQLNTWLNQLVAAKAGLGLAVLPCYLGDTEPDLVRLVAEPVPALTRELWIVTHADLKRTGRVRAFFDVVGGGLVDDRAMLSGSLDAAPGAS